MKANCLKSSLNHAAWSVTNVHLTVRLNFEPLKLKMMPTDLMTPRAYPMSSIPPRARPTTLPPNRLLLLAYKLTWKTLQCFVCLVIDRLLSSRAHLEEIVNRQPVTKNKISYEQSNKNCFVRCETIKLRDTLEHTAHHGRYTAHCGEHTADC